MSEPVTPGEPSRIKRVSDLLSPVEREQLQADLAEMVRLRRAAEHAANEVRW